MTVSAAIPAYGTLLQLSDGGSPAIFTSIAEVQTLDGPGLERDMIEVTHLESLQGWKEYIGGLIDGGMIDIGVNYLPTDATHMSMLTKLTAVPSALATYRIVWPDFGATSFSVTNPGSSPTWTSGSPHGWLTAQPVTLSSSGTLPGGFVAGRIYFLRYATSTTFRLYPSSAQAAANSGQISATDSGSGTHTVKGTSNWAFSGQFKGFKSSAETKSQLKGTAKMQVSGASTITP